MLKKIMTSFPLVPVEGDGIIIRRDIITGIEKVNFLIEKAKKEAMNERLNIKNECKHLAERAHLEGYVQGFTLFLTQFTDLVNHCEKIVREKQEFLAGEITNLIRESVNSPALLIDVIAEWANILPAKSEPMNLYFPETMQVYFSEIDTGLRSRISIPYLISFHNSEKFILKWKEYIAEYSPIQYSTDLGECLKNILAEHQKSDRKLIKNILMEFIESSSEKFNSE